jgi:hypothetical protein
MKSRFRRGCGSILGLILVAASLSACTVGLDPSSSPTVVSGAAEPDSSAATGLTLITNVGTRQKPIGVEWGDDVLAEGGPVWLGDDGSVVFQSPNRFVPDTNYLDSRQIFRWTPEFGLSLITNVGTDAATPIGANGYSRVSDVNAEGSIVFVSDATDLPGANGNSQIYLWTAADGLTLIQDTGLGRPSGPFYPTNYGPYFPKLSDDGSIVFCRYASLGDGTHYQIYRWTAEDGVALLGEFVDRLHEYAELPGKVWFGIPCLRDDGSVVISTNDPSYPGSNGLEQVYLWTPAVGMALITNVGTADHPLGANGHSDGGLEDDGSVEVVTHATNLPGGNGAPPSGLGGDNVQWYRWTPNDGLTLIRDTYTDPADSPLCVPGGGGYEWGSSDGTPVLFQSDDPNLPGANGYSQVYLCTARDGLVLVTNAGTPQAPIGTIPDADDWGKFQLEFHLGSSGDSVLVKIAGTNLPGGAGVKEIETWSELYWWTATDGLTLISNCGTPQAPVGCGGGFSSNRDYWLGTDDSVVFMSHAAGLPGSNGSNQLYLWTPPR